MLQHTVSSVAVKSSNHWLPVNYGAVITQRVLRDTAGRKRDERVEPFRRSRRRFPEGRKYTLRSASARICMTDTQACAHSNIFTWIEIVASTEIHRVYILISTEIFPPRLLNDGTFFQEYYESLIGRRNPTRALREASTSLLYLSLILIIIFFSFQEGTKNNFQKNFLLNFLHVRTFVLSTSFGRSTWQRSTE